MTRRSYISKTINEEQERPRLVSQALENTVNKDIARLNAVCESLSSLHEVIDYRFIGFNNLNAILERFSERTKSDMSDSALKVLRVSTESSLREQRVSTELSMEGVRVGLRNIWDTILNLFSKVGTKIKEIFKYTTDVSYRIKANAESMREKIERNDRSIQRVDVIKSSSISKGFSIDGKTNFFTTKEIFNNHLEASSGSAKFGEVISDFLNQSTNLVKELSTKSSSHVEKDPGWLKRIITDHNKKYSEYMKNIISNFKVNTGNDTKKIDISGRLFNGRTINADYVLVDENEQIYEYHFSIAENKEEQIPDECDVLSYADMLKLVDLVEALNEKTIALTKNVKQIEQGIKTIENIAKLAEKLTLVQSKKDVKVIKKASDKIEDIKDKQEEKTSMSNESYSLALEETKEQYDEKRDNAISYNAKEVSRLIKNEANRIKTLMKNSSSLLGQMPRGNIAACKMGLEYIDQCLRAPRVEE